MGTWHGNPSTAERRYLLPMGWSRGASRIGLESRREAAWESIGDVAVSGDAQPWVRRVARDSSALWGRAGRPGPGFVDVLKGLRQVDRERVAVAVTSTKNHYQSTVDFLGAVGIPLFLGLIALDSFLTLDDLSYLMILLGLVAYVGMFAVYRTYTAIATTTAESIQFVLVELAPDHR